MSSARVSSGIRASESRYVLLAQCYCIFVYKSYILVGIYTVLQLTDLVTDVLPRVQGKKKCRSYPSYSSRDYCSVPKGRQLTDYMYVRGPTSAPAIGLVLEVWYLVVQDKSHKGDSTLSRLSRRNRQDSKTQGRFKYIDRHVSS